MNDNAIIVCLLLALAFGFLLPLATDYMEINNLEPEVQAQNLVSGIDTTQTYAYNLLYVTTDTDTVVKRVSTEFVHATEQLLDERTWGDSLTYHLRIGYIDAPTHADARRLVTSLQFLNEN